MLPKPNILLFIYLKNWEVNSLNILYTLYDSIHIQKLKKWKLSNYIFCKRGAIRKTTHIQQTPFNNRDQLKNTTRKCAQNYTLNCIIIKLLCAVNEKTNIFGQKHKLLIRKTNETNNCCSPLKTHTHNHTTYPSIALRISKCITNWAPSIGTLSYGVRRFSRRFSLKYGPSNSNFQSGQGFISFLSAVVRSKVTWSANYLPTKLQRKEKTKQKKIIIKHSMYTIARQWYMYNRGIYCEEDGRSDTEMPLNWEMISCKL